MKAVTVSFKLFLFLSFFVISSFAKDFRCSYRKVKLASVNESFATCEYHNIVHRHAYELFNTILILPEKKPSNITLSANLTISSSENHNDSSLIETTTVKNVVPITVDDIDRVSFNVSRIYSIPNSIFTTFRNLRAFDASQTRLHELTSLSFNKAEFLNYIFLQKNRLTIIKDFVFVHCKNLKILDLSSNQISEIQNSAFSSLANLELLNLAENKIKSINDGTLHYLISLQWLWINDNKIEFVTSSTFGKENKNLKGIYLNGNNELSAISSHAFDELDQLKYLFLEGCGCINENFRNYQIYNNVGIKFLLKSCHNNFKKLFPNDEKKFDVNFQENFINQDCKDFIDARKEELIYLDEAIRKFNLTLQP